MDQEKDAEKKPSKRRLIEDWLAAARPDRITLDHWRTLLALHRPISESYLRTLLRDSGVPLDPAVDGVRQDSLDTVEHSLIALTDAYGAARAAGDRETVSAIRKAVISGKDHARWAAERVADAAKQAEKSEMAQWMLVWLENPPLFPEWIRVRRLAMEREALEETAIEAPPTLPE